MAWVFNRSRLHRCMHVPVRSGISTSMYKKPLPQNNILLQNHFLFRHVFFWSLRTAAEEKLLHFRREKLPRLRLDGRQAILVDEHRLMFEPALPGLLRHVVVDSLSEFTGVGCVVEAFGLGRQDDTVNGSGP